MTLSVGPKLGLLVNGDPGEEHYDLLMAQFRGLDLLVQATVASMTETTPPPTPAEGDAYIIPTGATGSWFGHTNDIARWSNVNSFWEFFTPKRNWVFGVDDEGTDGVMKRFDGTDWVDLV